MWCLEVAATCGSAIDATWSLRQETSGSFLFVSVLTAVRFAKGTGSFRFYLVLVRVMLVWVRPGRDTNRVGL